MPAIFAGALFAFTLSLDEFIITLFLIGGAQHAADLHLHAGQVRDHARGERACDAAARRVADADRARLRAAAASGACGGVPLAGLAQSDSTQRAVAGARDRGLDRRDAAVRRRGRSGTARAAGLRSPRRRRRRGCGRPRRSPRRGRRGSGRAACALGVRGRVLDDHLLGAVDRADEQLGRQLLVPGEPGLRPSSSKSSWFLRPPRPRRARASPTRRRRSGGAAPHSPRAGRRRTSGSRPAPR